MLYRPSVDALHRLRLTLDTPSHEGTERGGNSGTKRSRRWSPRARRSESAVCRCLVRAGVIDPARSRRRIEHWKRWERGGPMELWQLDVVGGFLLADGTTAKALTGIDDHSRFCISATLMPRERT